MVKRKGLTGGDQPKIVWVGGEVLAKIGELVESKTAK